MAKQEEYSHSFSKALNLSIILDEPIPSMAKLEPLGTAAHDLGIRFKLMLPGWFPRLNTLITTRPGEHHQLHGQSSAATSGKRTYIVASLIRAIRRLSQPLLVLYVYGTR